MLQCSTSLWSADLANLAAEIKRVEPYSERFHLDVADGHYSPTMLFFPDLVAAPVQGRHLDYHWTGDRVDLVREAGGGTVYRVE